MNSFNSIMNETNSGEAVQRDIEGLENWVDKWLMSFNSKKCKVMHVGKNNQQTKYFIQD